MKSAIAFDVYGTLVDPLGMADHLKSLVGDQAGRFAELWRTKQLEYAFRRALMRAYRPFSVCTREALLYTEEYLGLILPGQSRATLMERYKDLPPFADAAPGLESLKRNGHWVVALSNGETAALRQVLQSARLLSFFDDVISADEVRTFKPDPVIYRHALQRLGQAGDNTWLVSSNPFDVIGAKTAGLRAAWVKRNRIVFDPWGVEPDLVLASLEQLAPLLAEQGS